MDLNRWGIGKIAKISEGYRGLSRFLTDVLDGERSLVAETGEETTALAFETRSDFENVPAPKSGRFVKGRTLPHGEAVFETFSPFFEAGFLFRAHQGKAERLRSLFVLGRVFAPGESGEVEVRLPLPALATSGVQIGRAAPLLREFGLEGIEAFDGASAFAFAPTSEWIFVFICTRPHPWQVSAVEKAWQITKARMSGDT